MRACVRAAGGEGAGAALRVALDLMFGARLPVLLAWGPEERLVYNDACIPLLGDRHPAAFGQPLARPAPDAMADAGPDARDDAWSGLAPVAAALAGEASLVEDLRFHVQQDGREARGAGADGGAGQAPLAPGIEAAACRPLRVIIVDDNQDAADSLAMLLRAQGHTVLVEYTAMAALRRAIAERPDAMVLDIGLPDMDGYQLAARLRAQPETRGALLIAATGYGLARDRERAREAGFAHHLVKPVDMAALVRILQGVASARAAGSPG